MVNDEVIEQADDVFGAVPGLSRYPAIGGEQAARKTGRVHRNRDEMRQRQVAFRPRFAAGVLHRFDVALRHATDALEGMKMAVLDVIAAVRVIVVLGEGFGVVHVVFGVMIEFVEGATAEEDLADDVAASLVQHPVALEDVGRRDLHGGELIRRLALQRRHLQRRQLDVRCKRTHSQTSRKPMMMCLSSMGRPCRAAGRQTPHPRSSQEPPLTIARPGPASVAVHS